MDAETIQFDLFVVVYQNFYEFLNLQAVDLVALIVADDPILYPLQIRLFLRHEKYD